MQLGESELAGAINRDEQVEPSFFRVHLGYVDVKVADRITLELLIGLIAGHIRQAADAMALQTAMKR
jgi:hypothetical protein